MDRMEIIEDFKIFLKENYDLVREHSIKIEDLLQDDARIPDSEWDEL